MANKKLVFPVLRRLRQEDCKFEVDFDYTKGKNKRKQTNKQHLTED